MEEGGGRERGKEGEGEGGREGGRWSEEGGMGEARIVWVDIQCGWCLSP